MPNILLNKIMHSSELLFLQNADYEALRQNAVSFFKEAENAPDTLANRFVLHMVGAMTISTKLDKKDTYDFITKLRSIYNPKELALHAPCDRDKEIPVYPDLYPLVDIVDDEIKKQSAQTYDPRIAKAFIGSFVAMAYTEVSFFSATQSSAKEHQNTPATINYTRLMKLMEGNSSTKKPIINSEILFVGASVFHPSLEGMVTKVFPNISIISPYNNGKILHFKESIKATKRYDYVIAANMLNENLSELHVTNDLSLPNNYRPEIINKFTRLGDQSAGQVFAALTNMVKQSGKLFTPTNYKWKEENANTFFQKPLHDACGVKLFYAERGTRDFKDWDPRCTDYCIFEKINQKITTDRDLEAVRKQTSNYSTSIHQYSYEPHAIHKMPTGSELHIG